MKRSERIITTLWWGFIIFSCAWFGYGIITKTDASESSTVVSEITHEETSSR